MELWKQKFTELLTERFKEIRIKNPRFSLRSYARLTKVAPGAMSNLLNQKGPWFPPPVRALQILKLAGVGPQSINSLAAMTYQSVTTHLKDLPEGYKELLLDRRHIPVLFSFSYNQRRTVTELADIFQTTEKKISEILADLIQLGLLKKEADGGLSYQYQDVWKIGNVIEAQQLQLAILEELQNKGQVKTFTFTGSTRHIPFIEQEIENLMNRVVSVMDGEESKNEIFQLLIGFSPLTNENL